MKILMVIFACIFCLATTPAIADYACIADAKSCTDDLRKSSPDNKATACQHCGCHASTANLSSPALTISELVILQTPPIYDHYLKPSRTVGPPLEPPTA